MKRILIAFSVLSIYTAYCRLPTVVPEAQGRAQMISRDDINVPDRIKDISAEIFMRYLQKSWLPNWNVKEKSIKSMFGNEMLHKKIWKFLDENPSQLGIMLGKPQIELVFGAEKICEKYLKNRINVIISIAILFEISALEIACSLKDTIAGGRSLTGYEAIDARRYVCNATIPQLVSHIRQTARKLLLSALHGIYKDYGRRIIEEIFEDISTNEYIKLSEARIMKFISKCDKLVAKKLDREKAKKECMPILTKDVIKKLETVTSKMSKLTKDQCLGVLQGLQYSRTFLVDTWINMQKKSRNVYNELKQISDYLYQNAGYEQIYYAVHKKPIPHNVNKKSDYVNLKLPTAIIKSPTPEKLEAYIQIRANVKNYIKNKIIQHIDNKLYIPLIDGSLKYNLMQGYEENKLLYRGKADFEKKVVTAIEHAQNAYNYH